VNIFANNTGDKRLSNEHGMYVLRTDLDVIGKRYYILKKPLGYCLLVYPHGMASQKSLGLLFTDLSSM
jgi:hypothetical protein